MELQEFKKLVGATDDVAKVTEIAEPKTLSREEIEMVNGGFFSVGIQWTSTF